MRLHAELVEGRTFGRSALILGQVPEGGSGSTDFAAV